MASLVQYILKKYYWISTTIRHLQKQKGDFFPLISIMVAKCGALKGRGASNCLKALVAAVCTFVKKLCSYLHHQEIQNWAA